MARTLAGYIVPVVQGATSERTLAEYITLAGVGDVTEEAAQVSVAFGAAAGLNAEAKVAALAEVAFGAAAGLNASATTIVLAEAAFGAAAGLNAQASTAVFAEVSFGAAAGLTAEPEVIALASVQFGAAAGLSATVSPIQQIEVAFGAAAGIIADPSAGVRAEVAFGAAAGITVDITSTVEVAVAFGAAASISSSLVIAPIVTEIKFGAAAGIRDGYIGPGTGIVVPRDRDIYKYLREGDEQPVLMVQSGMKGQKGIVEVLTRTVRDNSNRQELRVRLTEESSLRNLKSLRSGRKPVFQATTRDDAGTRIGNVNRRERKSNRR